MNIVSPHDFREVARRRLPRFLFDYADGGAYQEATLRRNVEDLASLSLRQRVLSGSGQLELATTLFGRSLALPLVLGPVGIAGMYRRRGETQAAVAARNAGVPFCVSTVALCSLEEVAAAAGHDSLWFQLYVIRDRGFMRDMLARARAVGAQALVFTVDMPVPGVRYRDGHSGMSGRWASWQRSLQALTKPAWSWDVGLLGRPHRLGNLSTVLGRSSGLRDYMGWLGSNFDPSIMWKDLEWIRSEWPGSLIIKGVMEAADAREAAALGADGIVVSNHGGRQLDSVASTARAVPRVVEAVGDRVTVLADGGVRSGLDVIKMLALGARGILLGRAWVYALAAGGRAGVAQLLDLMAAEMRVAMTLTGVSKVSAIGSAILDTD